MILGGKLTWQFIIDEARAELSFQLFCYTKPMADLIGAEWLIFKSIKTGSANMPNFRDRNRICPKTFHL